jgi:hypothetical protein
MDTLKTLPEIPDEDTPPIRWAPWLTHRRLILFVIGWLVLFALLSVFVSSVMMLRLREEHENRVFRVLPYSIRLFT